MKKPNQNLFRIAVLGFFLSVFHITGNSATVSEMDIPKDGNSKSVFAVQQQKSVSGKVTDSANSPIPGVSVVVKGITANYFRKVV